MVWRVAEVYVRRQPSIKQKPTDPCRILSRCLERLDSEGALEPLKSTIRSKRLRTVLPNLWSGDCVYVLLVLSSQKHVHTGVRGVLYVILMKDIDR